MLEFRTEERKERLFEVLSKRKKSITAVFENINDPHNLMACLRSCDAIGVYEVHTIDCEMKIKKKKVGHGSSSSAKKWVKQNKYEYIEDCFEKIKSEGKKIYTTHLASDSVSLYDLDLNQPIAMVFGNEHSGVSEKAVSMADGNFLIPQIGMIQSLNISVACAVTMYEIYRQRALYNRINEAEIFGEELDLIYNEWLLPKSIKRKM
ncbi:MAG: RNA methyltransferase [Candidatus Kapabacteria bacterium]|nr:RNA methyltransferase [Candidatus Kapabacteria bacterium]